MATTAATPSRTATSATKGRAFPLGFFVLAFAFTWSLWWAAALEARGLIPALPVPAVFLGVFGPMVAAVALTARDSGRAGLRPLLGRVTRLGVPPGWDGVGLLGPLALQLAPMGLHVALGAQ